MEKIAICSLLQYFDPTALSFHWLYQDCINTSWLYQNTWCKATSKAHEPYHHSPSTWLPAEWSCCEPSARCLWLQCKCSQAPKTLKNVIFILKKDFFLLVLTHSLLSNYTFLYGPFKQNKKNGMFICMCTCVRVCASWAQRRPDSNFYLSFEQPNTNSPCSSANVVVSHLEAFSSGGHFRARDHLFPFPMGQLGSVPTR